MQVLPLIAVFAATCFMQAGDAPRRPSRLAELIRARSEIKSAEVELKIHFNASSVRPAVAGADWKLHAWFESDQSAFRFDLDKTKTHERSGPSGQKYAFDGAVYRVINDVGNPKICMREFVNAEPSAVPEAYDPRLLGIFQTPFVGLHNYSLEDARKVVDDAKSFVREDAADGFTETYTHPSGGVDVFYFTNNGSLARIVTQSRPGTNRRSETRLFYDDQSEKNPFLFPSRVEFKQQNDGAPTMDEVWHIRVVNVNQPLDRALCSWQSLAPAPGTPLTVDNNNLVGPDSKRWDGAKFIKYEPNARPVDFANVSRTQDPTSQIAAIAFATCAVILIGLVAARLLRRRQGA